MEGDMGQVLIRNLDDDVIERLRLRATIKGASLEQELRDILTTASALTGEQREALLAGFHLRHGQIKVARNPEDLIREERDSR
jgi:plasmid stability protein